MEKQGMANRRRFRRFGLLILFFSGLNAAAQTGESAVEAAGELEVSVQSSPVNPVRGGSWTITILVKHPVPSEVTIRPPQFPPSLMLERVRTELRLLTRPGRSDEAGPLPPPESSAARADQGSGARGSAPDRWTAVEFLFSPQSPGGITLEPFEALAGGRSAKTREISVRVLDEDGAARRYVPRFRWDRAAPLSAGETGEFALRLTNWDPQKKAPRDFLKGKAPPGAILEELPMRGPGPEGEFVYPLRIIPLEETGLVVAAFSFQWEGVSLEVPSLTVPVRPAPRRAAPRESAPPAPAPVPPPFPESRAAVFPLFKSEYEEILSEVKAHWEEGRRARALAEIRRKERESWAGPALSPLRREMEQSLGLGLTDDETWRPGNSSVFFWFFPVVSSVVVLLLLRRARKPGFFAVTSGKAGGYKIRIILIAVLVLAFVFVLEITGRGGTLVSGNRAVLEKTSAYRVPEKGGSVNVFFGEGQPVNIGASQGDWVYAESADGRAGWIPSASVIEY